MRGQGIGWIPPKRNLACRSACGASRQNGQNTFWISSAVPVLYGRNGAGRGSKLCRNIWITSLSALTAAPSGCAFPSMLSIRPKSNAPTAARRSALGANCRRILRTRAALTAFSACRKAGSNEWNKNARQGRSLPAQIGSQRKLHAGRSWTRRFQRRLRLIARRIGVGTRQARGGRFHILDRECGDAHSKRSTRPSSHIALANRICLESTTSFLRMAGRDEAVRGNSARTPRPAVRHR